ncbi:hypothetical protein BU15DRAFT_80016 [Melanogaster broomeanus]|nr:hypothetical protein BU15DRAFT_80016 [Melanogaster broomeanus]
MFNTTATPDSSSVSSSSTPPQSPYVDFTTSINGVDYQIDSAGNLVRLRSEVSSLGYCPVGIRNRSDTLAPDVVFGLSFLRSVYVYVVSSFSFALLPFTPLLSFETILFASASQRTLVQGTMTSPSPQFQPYPITDLAKRQCQHRPIATMLLPDRAESIASKETSRRKHAAPEASDSINNDHTPAKSHHLEQTRSRTLRISSKSSLNPSARAPSRTAEISLFRSRSLSGLLLGGSARPGWDDEKAGFAAKSSSSSPGDDDDDEEDDSTAAFRSPQWVTVAFGAWLGDSSDAG